MNLQYTDHQYQSFGSYPRWIWVSQVHFQCSGSNHSTLGKFRAWGLKWAHWEMKQLVMIRIKFFLWFLLVSNNYCYFRCFCDKMTKSSFTNQQLNSKQYFKLPQALVVFWGDFHLLSFLRRFFKFRFNFVSSRVLLERIEIFTNF